MSDMEDNSVKTEPQQSKKPYRQPSLRVYGNIRTLTGAAGTMSSVADGGMGLSNKT